MSLFSPRPFQVKRTHRLLLTGVVVLLSLNVTVKSYADSNAEPWNPLTWFGKSSSSASPASTTPQNAPTATPTNATSEASQNPTSTTTPQNPTPDATGNATSSPQDTSSNAAPQTDSSSVQQDQSPPSTASDADLKNKAALIETEKGNIAMILYPQQAPLTVANFVKLVNQGFYNHGNMRFHRVVPGFVIQTGDPTGTGAGGSPDHIPLEAKNKLSHNAKGMVGMARGLDLDSASSQFYVTLEPQPSLDGKYAVFGKVISGLPVVEKIEKGDMMYGVKMVDLNTITPDVAPKKHLF